MKKNTHICAAPVKCCITQKILRIHLQNDKHLHKFFLPHPPPFPSPRDSNRTETPIKSNLPRNHRADQLLPNLNSPVFARNVRVNAKPHSLLNDQASREEPKEIYFIKHNNKPHTEGNRRTEMGKSPRITLPCAT